MNKYYFTFLQKSSFRNGYMVVEATSEREAKQKMIDMYGFPIIFAFSYTEAEKFDTQIEKYKLYPIPFGYMPEDEPDDCDYDEQF